MPLFAPTDPKLKSFYDWKATGKDRVRMKQVVDFLKRYGPSTSQEMAKLLHLPINSLTGPIDALVNEHRVVEKALDSSGAVVKRINDVTGKPNTVYRLVNEDATFN
jgi:predicted ArsR family transcriptional regulator